MDHTSHLTRRRILSGAALAASAAPLAQAHVDGRSQAQLLRRPYKPADGGEERNYLLYVPTGFYTETGREWPVMMFLHGSGERGNGRDELDMTLMHGPVMEAWIQGRDLPFLIIQPQTPRGDRGNPPDLSRVPQRNPDGPPPPRNYGTRSETPMARVETGDLINWSERNARNAGGELLERDLLTMIYETIADFRGDEDRVYCTGLSMGGRATWNIAQNHPERFAAVAPVCGDADPSKMQPIVDAKLPIWIHEGGRDTTVTPENVLAAAKALEAAGHPEVRFTVHEDLGHNVWTRVYEGDDLYNWLLRNRRNA